MFSQVNTRPNDQRHFHRTNHFIIALTLNEVGLTNDQLLFNMFKTIKHEFTFQLLLQDTKN